MTKTENSLCEPNNTLNNDYCARSISLHAIPRVSQEPTSCPGENTADLNPTQWQTSSLRATDQWNTIFA